MEVLYALEALCFPALDGIMLLLRIVIAVLVPFSPMYLGVHTPMDVLAGSGLALLQVWKLRPVMREDNVLRMKKLIVVMLVLALGLLAFVELFPYPQYMDPYNLESGTKNAYTMVGCLTGVAIVYLAERKYVNYETKAVRWAQLLSC